MACDRKRQFDKESENWASNEDSDYDYLPKKEAEEKEGEEEEAEEEESEEEESEEEESEEEESEEKESEEKEAEEKEAEKVFNHEPMLVGWLPEGLFVRKEVPFQKVQCSSNSEKVAQTADTSNLSPLGSDSAASASNLSPLGSDRAASASNLSPLGSDSAASASNLVFSNDSYLPWNDYFMGLCFLTSARSKDPKTKVGACIVDDKDRIVSLGYNGMPRGIKDTDLPWGKIAEHPYETKYPYVCHAEMNAIMNGRKAPLEDCSLYVTKFPCSECTKLIIQAGIRKVIFAEKVPDPVDEQIPSHRMFSLAGVTCRKFIPYVDRLTLNMENGYGSVEIV